MTAATRVPDTRSEEGASFAAEPFSASWNDEHPPHETASRELHVDSGACLHFEGSAGGFEPYDALVRKALGIPDSPPVAALIVTPSFRAPWALLLARAHGKAFALRVTRLSRDVWAAMMTRMSELQGPTVDLSQDQQRRALADVSVETAIAERPIDRTTAILFIALWQALTARAQVVESHIVAVHGTGYSFVAGGRAGTTVSPKHGSVLNLTTSAAERLARFVESPNADDQSDLAFVRADLKEALARTRNREPCIRIVER